MIALVFLSIFSLGLATPTPGSCYWTEAVTETVTTTDADGQESTSTNTVSEATCSYEPIISGDNADISDKCTDDLRQCTSFLTQSDCETRLSADDAVCAWIPSDNSGDFMGIDGVCVSHPVKLCDLYDCIKDEAGVNVGRSALCQQATSSSSCSGTTFAAISSFQADQSLLNDFSGYLALDSFGECFDDQSVRNDEEGGEWVFCHKNRQFLSSNENNADYSPCAKNVISSHASCVGDDSCEGATIEGTALCLGDDSCATSTFKPQTNTDIVVCAGESSCEDAEGKERKDLDEDTEETAGYFCGGPWGAPVDARDACRGFTAKDNTVCQAETSCEDADIDAMIVLCADMVEGDSKVCKDAQIKAEQVMCNTENSCDEAVITGNDVECAKESACVDATIKLGKSMGKDLEDPRVECYSLDSSGNYEDFSSETGPCYGAMFSYVLPLVEGNESVRCIGEYSCQDAEIKAEAHCLSANSCKGAYIAKDTICAAGACEETHFTQGTICCGPGCFADEDNNLLGANTKDEFGADYEDADDSGCEVEVKSMKEHPTYEEYKCKRCGKETIIGWITDNKANLVIALVVTILVFLMIVAGIFFALKKAGLVNGCGGSTEELDE